MAQSKYMLFYSVEFLYWLAKSYSKWFFHSTYSPIQNCKLHILGTVSHVHLKKMFSKFECCYINQGPVVQSIVSLMSLLVVKILTVLVSTISTVIHRNFC